MKIFTKFRLNYFGEGGAGAASSGASGGNATASSPGADATNTGVDAEKADGSVAENIENNSAEGGNPEVQAKTREERRKAYDAYINGEGKEFYAEDTKNIVSKRVKGEKELKAQVDKLNPFVEAIADKYNLDPSDLDGLMKAIQGDRDFFAEAAADAGMDSPETYRKFKESERKAKAFGAEQKRIADERAAAERDSFVSNKLQEWNKEAEALKAKHSDFDFEKESKDKQFMQMLRAGVSVEAAYQAKHHSELLHKAVTDAKAETEKAVVENIRAKGQRPVEGGAHSTSAPQTGFDVRNLTREQRAEIARQASYGRRIDLK
jgi:hypothetical protein